MNSTQKEEELINDLKNQKDTSDSFIFKVPENLERKNIAYYSIILDLETCKEALLQLKKRNKEIVQTSLFTTIIILYGKCFTDSSTTKSPKLEPDFFDSKNENLRKLHLNLMSMRHNFIAHRGQTEHEFGKAYFQIYPKTMIWGIKIGLQRKHSFELDEIPEYIKLIELSIKIAYEKYDKIGKKIMEHIMINFKHPDGGNKLELVNEIDPDLKKYVMNLKRKKQKN